MSIETEAVAEITKMLNRCPRLEGFIDQNDRIPLTDGHIDMYKSEGRSNANWRGRVPVQIKGRSSARKRRPGPSFSVPRVNLEAHRDTSGVLLFCVDVDLTGENVSWYAALTPYEIRRILGAAPSARKTISIRLKQLPEDPQSVERIVEVAHVGTRQNPFAFTDPKIFESVRHISMSTADELDLNSPSHLRQGEAVFALEVTTDSGDRIPLDISLEITPEQYLPQHRELTVKAGQISYNEVWVQRLSTDETLLTLRDGITILIRETEPHRTGEITITYHSSFSARKRALEFMLEAVDHGRLKIGSQAVALGDSADSTEVMEMREHLTYLRNLANLFDRFDVNAELIDLDSFNDEHIENLHALYDIFIEGTPSREVTDPAGRYLVPFGPWALMLVVVGGANGEPARYEDPFEPGAHRMFRWSADGDRSTTIPVTSYDIVEADHLPKVLNMRLNRISDAYEELATAQTTTTLANRRIMDLIASADSTPQRFDEFITSAADLNRWASDQEPDNTTHVLNRWQIAWRLNALTEDDRTEIRRTKRLCARDDGPAALRNELACALLLGDREDVEFLAKQLSTDERRAMEEWPIWKLYRDPRRGEPAVSFGELEGGSSQ